MGERGFHDRGRVGPILSFEGQNTIESRNGEVRQFGKRGAKSETTQQPQSIDIIGADVTNGCRSIVPHDVRKD